MARMVGQENEYLWKKESHYLDLALLATFLILIGGSFYLGYYAGARVVYTSSQSLSIFLTIVFVLLLYLWGVKFFFKKVFAYKKGRKGENSIYYALKGLSENFTVFQNVIIPGKNENIDFVVLGSNGLFTVEVKNYSGDITYENGILLDNGKPFEKDIIHQATRQWQTLRDYFKKTIGVDVYIQPIITFSGNRTKMHFGQKPVSQNIFVVKQEWLNEVITKHSPTQRLSEEQKIQIYDAIQSLVITPVNHR